MDKYIKYIIFLCIIGCAPKGVAPPVDPLSPDEVGKTIRKLKTESFEFIIKFNKPQMKGRIKGITTNGRTKVEGVWEFNDEDKEKFIGIGIGEREYKFEDGKWEVGQRTHLTDPVATLELVCSMEGYKFKGIDGESFLYEFDANLLFMDPGLYGTSIPGILWINAKTGVPQKVVAEAENIKWEFEIQSFGGKYEVTSPLATTHRIEIIIEPDCKVSTQIVGEILRQRFELYGYEEVRLFTPKSKMNTVAIEFLSESAPSEILQSLIQPGKVEIYRATYPTGNECKLNGAHFVGGNPTNPVFLHELIEGNVVKADFYPAVVGTRDTPIIELSFDKELPEDKRIAVVVDGGVIDVVPTVWGKSFKIEGDELTWIKIKLPIPCKVTLK